LKINKREFSGELFFKQGTSKLRHKN